MSETSPDRARRLLTAKAADQLAAILETTQGFHDQMTDAAFVGMCLSLITARDRFAVEAQETAKATAVERGSLYYGGRIYEVRPA